jgi:hypothetical protein
MLTWVLPLLMSFSTLCDSTASSTLHLQPGEGPFADLDAFFMSCGPRGPALPLEGPGPDSTLGRTSHYLRVTFHTCERSSWMTVDHIIELGRGCARKREAAYFLDFRRDISPLEYRTLGCGKYRPMPTEPDIVWVNSRNV